MTKKTAAIALLLLAPAALLWWAGARMERSERTVTVELSCHDDRCEASIDGGEPLVHEVPPRRRAKRLGLYAYNPWETETSVRFRNLHIDRIDGMRPYDLSLTELDHAGWLENDSTDAWTVVETAGLEFRGEPGTSSTALLAPPTDADFDLSVELDDPVDAGIAFRGYDAENTWLFIVRSMHNDAFFCLVHRGEVQEIAAIMPLAELTSGRELLRLGGLAGRIVFLSGLLLLALRALSVSWSSWSPDWKPRWVRLTAVFLFVATVLMCGSIANVWLQGIPHIPDESAYLFQARVFADGELWAEAPGHPEFFAHEHLIVQGDRWFSKYPPLFSAVLALGVLIGAPWLVNPLLAALTGWLVYRLGRELAGPVWGLVAWGLLLASPFFVVMGASFMSHMLTAMLGTAFLLCTVKRRWLLAGLCLGLAILTRPYTAALIALAVAPFLIWTWIRQRHENGEHGLMRAPAMLTLGVAPGIALFLAWGALHSAPGELTFNIYAQNESSDTLGFGPDKGATWLSTWGSLGHTPAKALRSTHNYLDYTSRHQFGWPFRLSFAFALAGLLWHGRRNEAWMLALIPVALAVGHGFYWATQHLVYGARYWFAGVPALVLLTALGLRALARDAAPALRPVVAAVVVACVAYNVVAYLPLRLRELPRFGGISVDLADSIDRAGVEGALVFVRATGPVFNDGFHLNDPTDPEATLFAHDRGAGNDPLLWQYPEREAWRWDGERLVPMSSRAGALP
jgi:hypothetical protein